jgi:peptidoglycan/xylan/chitin deacetylase (PgdA/CDA1 family)
MRDLQSSPDVAGYKGTRIMRISIFIVVAPLLCLGCTQENSISDQRASTPHEGADPGVKYIALTYDDGPDSEVTTRLLDVLKANGAKATFFVEGSLIASNGKIIKKMDAEGHELGNHTLTHARLTELDGDELRAEIEGASAALRTWTGRAPRVLRPPRAAIDMEVKQVARDNGLAIALFDNYPNDSRPWRSSEAISDSIVTEARDGGIVFLHDTSMRSVDATALVIRDLSKKGYRFVTLSELIAKKSQIEPGAVYRNGYIAEP